MLRSKVPDNFVPISAIVEAKTTPAVSTSARAVRVAAPLQLDTDSSSSSSAFAGVVKTPRAVDLPLPAAPLSTTAAAAAAAAAATAAANTLAVKIATPLHKQLAAQQKQLEQLQAMQAEMQQQLANNHHAQQSSQSSSMVIDEASVPVPDEQAPRRISKATQQRRASVCVYELLVLFFVL